MSSRPDLGSACASPDRLVNATFLPASRRLCPSPVNCASLRYVALSGNSSARCPRRCARAAVAVQALMNELDLMGRLQHPNIVRLLEYFLQDDPALPHCGACIIVMDLLHGSDLMDYMDEVGGFSRDDVTVRSLRLFISSFLPRTPPALLSSESCFSRFRLLN